MKPWLHIIGIGEDGMEGLSLNALDILASADVIFGGKRHQKLIDVMAKRFEWPSPFDMMTETLRSQSDKLVVVLATGDPLWYSVGARLGREFHSSEIVYHPQVSAFQLAACRLGWSIPDCETLTVHGRKIEKMIPFIAPKMRLILLTTGSDTPKAIAKILNDRGYGNSHISVFGSMGGDAETRHEGIASNWEEDVPEFNTMAVECVASENAQITSHMASLPDDMFDHDGTMTKQDIRSITVSKLMPMRGQLLWDIGCGCGSVAIEWMRAGRDARAIGIEAREDRRAFAISNAYKLGAPKLQVIDGTAPQALDELPQPDAIFIGGGLSKETFQKAWNELLPFGRLVANAVTLDSEHILLELFKEFGGDLTRLQVSKADPIGRVTGWRPSMPVTQWSIIKS